MQEQLPNVALELTGRTKCRTCSVRKADTSWRASADLKATRKNESPYKPYSLLCVLGVSQVTWGVIQLFVQSFHLFVFLLPDFADPLLETSAELRVVLVITLSHFDRNWDLTHAYYDFFDFALQEVSESRDTTRVDNVEIQQRFEFIAHGV